MTWSSWIRRHSPKSRSSIKKAVKGYREINLRGMKLVKDGGYLATCSCSHFMDQELFTKTIGQAAQNVHKQAAAGGVQDTGAGSSDICGERGILII